MAGSVVARFGLPGSEPAEIVAPLEDVLGTAWMAEELPSVDDDPIGVSAG